MKQCVRFTSFWRWRSETGEIFFLDTELGPAWGFSRLELLLTVNSGSADELENYAMGGHQAPTRKLFCGRRIVKQNFSCKTFYRTSRKRILDAAQYFMVAELNETL
jgi:hypothetical protein